MVFGDDRHLGHRDRTCEPHLGAVGLPDRNSLQAEPVERQQADPSGEIAGHLRFSDEVEGVCSLPHRPAKAGPEASGIGGLVEGSPVDNRADESPGVGTGSRPIGGRWFEANRSVRDGVDPAPQRHLMQR
jgi:hypothetical protein